MRMLEENFPEFKEKLGELDAVYFGNEKRLINDKMIHFICLALAIRGRSKPCVLIHYKGAQEAGATKQELAQLIALTMREAAGQDDQWAHYALGDLK